MSQLVLHSLLASTPVAVDSFKCRCDIVCDIFLNASNILQFENINATAFRHISLIVVFANSFGVENSIISEICRQLHRTEQFDTIFFAPSIQWE